MNRREFVRVGAAAAGSLLIPRRTRALLRPPADGPVVPSLAFLDRPGAGEISILTTGDSILFRSHAELTGPAYAPLFAMQRACDLAITNCEVVLSAHGYPKPKDVSHAAPSEADEFAWEGIDMVSLANNHGMDLGAAGLADTCAALDARRIAHAGGGANLAAALAPAVLTRKGIRVGLLSFVCMTSNVASESAAAANRPGLAAIQGYPVRPVSGDAHAPVLNAPDDRALAQMEEAIRRARPQADFLIVAYHMHWGDRFHLDEGRRIIAHAAVDAGADLIVGHGPHVIDPVERYKGRLIFYSLGNFFFQIFQGNRDADAFGPNWPLGKSIFSFTTSTDYWEALAPRFIVDREGVRRVQILPIQVTRDGNPRLPSVDTGRAIIADLVERSKPYGAVITSRDWYGEIAVAGTA